MPSASSLWFLVEVLLYASMIGLSCAVMQDAWIGRVSEMAQVIRSNAHGMSMHVVRLWLRGTKPVVLEDGKLYVSRTDKSFAMQVLYESMLVCAVEPVECVDAVRSRFRHC